MHVCACFIESRLGMRKGLCVFAPCVYVYRIHNSAYNVSIWVQFHSVNVRRAGAKAHKVVASARLLRLQPVLQRQGHLLQPPDPLVGLGLVPPGGVHLGRRLVLPLLLDGHGLFEDLVLGRDAVVLGAEGVALGHGPVLFGREAVDFGRLMVNVTAEVVDHLLLLLLLRLVVLLLRLVVVGGGLAVPDGGRRGARRRRILQQIETCPLERRGS